MLSNCKCLVTGASSGIGAATCRVLRAHGATVVGVGRQEAALQSLQSDGHLDSYIIADLTEAGACQKVVESAIQSLGGSLTTLVNAAGVLRGGAVGDPKTDLSNYNFNFQINLQAPFELVHYALPYLKESAKLHEKKAIASIVNVSSVNGKQSFAGCATYCMSKAALDQFTRCASVDLAPFGIRVNGVNPGVIETNLQTTGGLSTDQYEAFLKRSITTTHPLAATLQRVGQPEEVGELIAFLVSDKAQFLTGECIAIDGGRQNLGAR